MITDLIAANRSCRRFDENHAVDVNTLQELVDMARLSASGANLQPLKYILSCRSELNAEIFQCLGWAAYLKDWSGPQPGERPVAYIVILGDSTISKDFGVDHGIAAQSILLGARDSGLAGCMMGAINRKDLRTILSVQPHLKILLVIAIGKPKEEIVIETLGPDGDIRYWRDEQAVHHVPKRSLSEIIVASHAA
jgi:nitroreductase